MLNKNLAVLVAAISVMSNMDMANAQDTTPKHPYDYTFPRGHATPFEAWNTGDAIMAPEDKDAAEFAAMFASKMMTIVTRVEDTKAGKRAYVVVANQRCLIDMVRQDGKYLVSATKCSTKPFGKF